MLSDFKTTKNNHKSYQGDENMPDKRWEFNVNGSPSELEASGIIDFGRAKTSNFKRCG